MTALLFFWFTSELEQSGNRISNAGSMILTFSLGKTFILTKTENKTKKSLTQLSYCSEKRYCFYQWVLTFCKTKMPTSARLRGSWHYRVYLMKLNMFLYSLTKFQVSSIILTSFRQDGGNPPYHHRSINPLKPIQNSVKVFWDASLLFSQK